MTATIHNAYAENLMQLKMKCRDCGRVAMTDASGMSRRSGVRCIACGAMMDKTNEPLPVRPPAAPTMTKRHNKNRRKQPKPRPVKVDYYAYIASKKWATKRRKAFKFHGEKCNRCGRSVDLHVHHKTYRRLGREQMEDLEVLCVNCHAEEHDMDTSLDRELAAIIG